MANSCWLFIKFYWKALFSIIFPIIIMPIFLFHNRPAMRCLYVVCLMCGYWVLEIMPMGITALIPVVLFPLMNILDSKKVAPCYLSETNMLFLGGLMVAASLEHCNLHTRIALAVIKVVGCSPRKLMLGLLFVTMFLSMWISNSAATACMVPVVTATLKEIEQLGIGNMWIPEDPAVLEERRKIAAGGGAGTEGVKLGEDDCKLPTHLTIAYYVGIAYASGIGGLGTLVGTGTNMVAKGQFEELFPDKRDISFIEWMFVACPIMLIIMVPTLFWLQLLYMGLFRPNSQDALAIKVGKEGEEAAKVVIKKKIEELGPWTFQQIVIGTLFIVLILLWFFRKPQFIPGWAELFNKSPIGDSLPAIAVIILMFLIPSRPHCFRVCNKDEESRPKAKSPALLEWNVLRLKVPWGMIFLIGSGFAIAEGSKKSGMSKEVAAKLQILDSLPRVAVMMLSSTFACILTQLTSNVAICTILMPVLAQMAMDQGVEPLYYMMPAALACSFAYCLPVATPPNAIIAEPSHITSVEMMKVGVGACLISLIVLFAIFPFLGPLVFGL